MKTVTKIKLYNKLLGCTLIMMLASGIQLEATSGKYGWSVLVHIVLGIILTFLSVYHIYLHYGLSNWFSRFAKNRNPITRILWWVFLLTMITGMVVTIVWIGECVHSSLGGIHGKIGFLMVLIAIIHVVKHRKRII